MPKLKLSTTRRLLFVRGPGPELMIFRGMDRHVGIWATRGGYAVVLGDRVVKTPTAFQAIRLAKQTLFPEVLH